MRGGWHAGLVARTSSPGAPALRTAGSAALGAAFGFAAFLALGRSGGFGFSGEASRVPWTVIVPVGALRLAAASWCSPAVRGPVRWCRFAEWSLAGLAAAGTLAVAWLVGVYDNGWTVSGWADFGRTASLTLTVAVLPLSACAHVGARILLSRTHEPGVALAAAVVLAVSLGWIGYASLPHLSAWGPMLFALALCWVAAALPGRRTGDA